MPEREKDIELREAGEADMKMKWWELCRVFDFFKTIANGCLRIMERINGRLRELNKKIEESGR